MGTSHERQGREDDDRSQALAWVAAALRFEDLLEELRAPAGTASGGRRDRAWHHVPRGSTAAA